jgi:hypothetical protein
LENLPPTTTTTARPGDAPAIEKAWLNIDPDDGAEHHATSYQVASDAKLELQWTATNADKVHVSSADGDVGDFDAEGKTSVETKDGAVYTLVAVGKDGAESEPLTIEVFTHDPDECVSPHLDVQATTTTTAAPASTTTAAPGASTTAAPGTTTTAPGTTTTAPGPTTSAPGATTTAAPGTATLSKFEVDTSTLDDTGQFTLSWQIDGSTSDAEIALAVDTDPDGNGTSPAVTTGSDGSGSLQVTLEYTGTFNYTLTVTPKGGGAQMKSVAITFEPELSLVESYWFHGDGSTDPGAGSGSADPNANN